jgi:hypothetical protein
MASEIKVDTVSEKTAAGGVTIDGNLLKDTKVFTDQVDPKSGTDLTLGTSGDTVTIPSGVTITNSGTASGFGGGKIGQAVTALRADDTSNTTTSFADTNCTVVITPTATDSKILVHISIPTWIYRGGYVNCRYGAKIRRAISGGATTALVTSGANNNLGARLSDSPNTDDDFGVMFSYTLLDSPSTTSAVTYDVQFALDNADGTTYVIANVSDTTSYMTALEVLA